MKKRMPFLALIALCICSASATLSAQQTSPPEKTRDIVFGEFKPYTHATRWFSMIVPANWTVKEKTVDSEVIVSLIDPTENGVFVIRVWKSETRMTEKQKADAVKLFLDETMSKFPKFSKTEPKAQGDGVVTASFVYDSVVQNKTFPMSGYTSIVDKGNLAGFINLILPTDQHAQKIESARKMISSFRLDPDAAR